MRPDVALHPNQRFHLRIQTITHKLKLPIRRYKANRPVVLKPRKPHTLVKLDILHLDRLPPCRSSGRLKHDFIIQPKPQFRHPREIAFQLYGTKDLRAQDVAGRGDEKVQGFDDVEEDFVFAIANSFAAPGDGVGDGDGGAGLDFEFVGFLCYVSASIYLQSAAINWKAFFRPVSNSANEMKRRGRPTPVKSCSPSSADTQNPSSHPTARK